MMQLSLEQPTVRALLACVAQHGRAVHTTRTCRVGLLMMQLLLTFTRSQDCCQLL